jgi:Gas vesicle protein
VTTAVTAGAAAGVATRHRQVALVDLLDRLLGGGVVIEGEIMLAAADVDLVALDLKLLISSIDKLSRR